MIFPWHTDLFQPGRTVCVVIRASPLIWPTPYLAHTTRPGPSAFGRQGAPPVVFHAGLWVLGGYQQKRCHPGRRSRVPDLVPQCPLRSPLAVSLRRGLSVCDV